MKLTHVLSLLGVFLVLLTVAVTQEISVKRNGALAMKTRLAYAAFTGTVSISPKPIVAGQPITLTVVDGDLTANSSVSVTVLNQSTNESEIVTLPVTNTTTGTFVGTLPTTNASGAGANNSGNMNVQSGQTLVVTYIDASNSSGISSTVTDQTTVSAPTVTSPATVTGLTPTFLNSSSVSLKWDQNSSAGVTGYRLYFGTAPRTYNGTSAEGTSPLSFANRSTTTKVLTHLPAPVLPALPVVANVTLSPQNQAIAVSWSAAAGATGYKIYYSTTSFDTTNPPPANAVSITVGNTTSYTITGLTNGTRYYVAVTATAQPFYYFAVTAAVDLTQAPNPGSTNESSYSAEASQAMDPKITEGTFTPPPQSIIPEVIVAYPNLKNEGCFIATAAFGFYSAPQVQVLRDFRDRYLLTNAPGRAFVAWYYHYGPQGAHFLNQHPIFKPVVRLALLPLIVVALFLISTPVAVKMLVMLGVVLASAFLVRRKMLLCNGGVQ